jgi:hypothetical protein
MIYPIFSKIIFFWVFLLCVLGLIKSTEARPKEPPSPPVKIEFQGRTYEILQDSDLNLIKAKTPSTGGPIGQESSTSPESMVYSGILPSRILGQGSLTFELSEGKLRR